MRLNASGFSIEKYKLYELDKNDPKLYLTDYQRYKAKFINGEYAIVLGNKMLTTKYLQDFNAMPEIYGVLNEGIRLNNSNATSDELITLLDEKETLMIKDTKGGGGKGVYRLYKQEDGYYLDKNSMNLDDLKAILLSLKGYYISEVIKQADYAAKIYPGTVNSIRILMMRDPHTHDFFIATAVHKFGSSKTGSADNVWRGGLTALVDLDSGMLQRPILHKNNNRDMEWVDKHPDTLETIEGIKIPNWEEVKETLIKISNSFEMLDYIGWDVVITDEGVRLLEGNNYSEVSILQVHKPLLANQRVREFYQHHNIIKKSENAYE